MDPRTNLLFVDDDLLLLQGLETHFRRLGYAPYVASTGSEGLRQMYAVQPDLVALDLMMPQLDGWETCRRMREMSTVPIVILSGLDHEVDRVTGLKLGADDSALLCRDLCKPFSLKELDARIEAILRRRRQWGQSHWPGASYVTDDLLIDPQHWEVRRNGERVALTATELRLLLHLAENAGRVLSHQQLLERTWGTRDPDAEEHIKPYIWRLRQQLEADPSHPTHLLTERGFGYRLAAPGGA